MPMDPSRYPADWPAISRRIRDRAGDRCEHPGCGARHGATVCRDRDERPRELEPAEAEVMALEGRRVTRIVNTVHHIGAPRPDGSPGDPEDKHDNRPENLVLLCQLHHLRADAAASIKKAAETRRRRRDRAAGQAALFD